MSVEGPPRQPRSAQQTTRLLLSNAFRYDTWELASAKKGILKAGGVATTARLVFFPVERQSLPTTNAEALNLVLFDPDQRAFVGAAYRIDLRRLTEPLIFQCTPKQKLVVELLERSAAAPESYVVTHWGAIAVQSLQEAASITLRPGNAHLLLMQEALWPPASRPGATTAGVLSCECGLDKDLTLRQLMQELVPPGVFVPESFTKASAGPGTKAFRLKINHIQLAGTSRESTEGLHDPNTDWAIAAVAHNGYRQLGRGSEVPLVLDGGQGNDSASSSRSLDASTVSSSSRHEKTDKTNKTEKSNKPTLLRSELPLEIDGLPVHSATSLVLAIRRRAPGARAYSVVGFCVFPLCMMPMKDRDVRVENLPALRGPFSCEDARLMMLDSSTPYGRVPIAMTLTIEYHDTAVPATMAAAAGPGGSGALSVPGAAGSLQGSMGQRPSGSALVPTVGPDGLPVAAGGPATWAQLMGYEAQPTGTEQPAGFLSTSDLSGGPRPQGSQLLGAPPGAGPGVSASFPGAPGTPGAAAGGGIGGGAGGAPYGSIPEMIREARTSGPSDEGIFKLLCTIMEELHKVREAQDELMRRSAGAQHQGLSPAMQERLNQKLSDGPLDLVDLLPRPVAVSWAARQKMQDGLQSILHPVTGALLNDASAAVGILPTSLYGFRVDGLTLDTSLPAPADVCLLFSFGPLPYQQAGPIHTDSVEKTDTCESFRLTSLDRGGGFVWCEPLASLENAAMAKYKEGSSHSVVYLHVYDALTMFYVATAQLPLAHFHRPYNAECAMAAMDLMLQRDLHMTDQVVPPEVFPVVRQAGQLHVTLFTVGVGQEYGQPAKTTVLHEPNANTRLIVAKKIKHADKVMMAGGKENPPPTPTGSADGQPQAEGAATDDDLHRRRVEYLKHTLQRDSAGSPTLPGVPGPHVREAEQQADMEYRLRYVENKRDEAKSRRIAKALVQRLTVRVDVLAVAYRPETIKVPFVNPYSTPMQFFVEVDEHDVDVFSALRPNFTLGPRERAEVPLVLRFTADDVARPEESQDLVLVTAKLYTERRELVTRVEVSAQVSLPLVDRRYELYGAPGTEITKHALARVFSAASFPAQCSQAAFLQRMGDLCCYVATSSEDTTAQTSAALDPITQVYLTAWEEVSIQTVVPREAGAQRTEYVTLFYDADLTRVYETWEICVYACECITTREIYWGQTTALGLPAEGTDDLYCSDPAIQVSRRGPSYILRVRPREVGVQTALLHTLLQDTLKKTVLTIPTAYPTPTYTQVIELSLAEVTGPVFRRLTFVNRGDLEDVFTVHHNYKFQLRLSPAKFALAPGDSQFVSLQLDMLSLPPGQMEGRWPMWIFINNGEDKTIESYYLQVVVRAHPVVPVV